MFASLQSFAKVLPSIPGLIPQKALKVLSTVPQALGMSSLTSDMSPLERRRAREVSRLPLLPAMLGQCSSSVPLGDVTAHAGDRGVVFALLSAELAVSTELLLEFTWPILGGSSKGED